MTMTDRIKQRMREIGITQEELGKQAGITQPAIFKLLSGKTKRTTRLTEIAKALKARPEWIATGEGPVHGESLEAFSAEDLETLKELNALEPEKKQIVRATIRAMTSPPVGNVQAQVQTPDRHVA